MEKVTFGSVRTDAFEMEYFSFGSTEQPLVLLPGMSLHSVIPQGEAVAAQYALLTNDYRITLFDRKKDITDGYSIEDMARDTAQAMRSLGIKNADVVGFSQGGMIAQVLAARYPELVHKLVLGSTIARQNAVSRDTFDRWEALAAAGDVIGLNREVFRRVYSPTYREQYAEVFASLETQGTPEEMRRFVILDRACRNFDAYALLGQIRCPVLAVGAGRDLALDKIGTLEIAEALGCECHIFPEAPHAVYDEAPDYLPRLAAFLRADRR